MSDFKTLNGYNVKDNRIGELNNLNTTEKTNIVGAINELNTIKENIIPEVVYFDDYDNLFDLAEAVKDSGYKMCEGRIGDDDDNDLKTLIGNPITGANYTRCRFETVYGLPDYDICCIKITAFNPYGNQIYEKYINVADDDDVYSTPWIAIYDSNI